MHEPTAVYDEPPLEYVPAPHGRPAAEAAGQYEPAGHALAVRGEPAHTKPAGHGFATADVLPAL